MADLHRFERINPRTARNPKLCGPRPSKQLQARFFAPAAGPATVKAPALKRTECRAIFARDGGRCVYCGVQVALLDPARGWGGFSTSVRHAAIDHVFPRARGGQNDPGNLLLACIRCNSSKGAK